MRRSGPLPAAVAVVAAAFLIAGPVQAAKAPASGKWRGSVTPGSDINFKVKRGKVKRFAAGVKAQCFDRATGEPTRKVKLSVTPDEAITVSRGRFSFRVFDSFTGISSEGEGRFTRRKKAKGTLSATVRLDPANEECDGGATWKAKRKRR